MKYKIIQMNCKNCNYYEHFLSDAPCDKCTNNDKWRAQEQKIEQTCNTCKYDHNSIMDEPCSKCFSCDKWESNNEG